MPRIRVRLLADGVIEDAIRERLDPPAWNTALAALHSVAIALDEIHRNAYYAVQEAIDDYPVYVDETHAYGRGAMTTRSTWTRPTRTGEERND